MAARWRKQPSERGLASIGQSPRGYDLTDNGEWIIHVRPLFQGFGRDVVGWYWYGLDKNTVDQPKATAEEAKAEADAWFKKQRQEK